MKKKEEGGTIMVSIKLVFVAALMVVGVALVAPADVMAAPVPGAASCQPQGTGVTITPDDGGTGKWPIPRTTSTGGTIYEFLYVLTGQDPTKISNVQISLSWKITEILDAHGSNALLAPCVGSQANNNFGFNICDARMASLTANDVSAPAFRSIFSRSISAHAARGGVSLKFGTKIGSCSPLEVPDPEAAPSFASVNQYDVVTVNATAYCIELGPSGCPTGKAPFVCGQDPIATALPLANISIFDNDTLISHLPLWFQGTAENPACTRGQIVGNPGSCYMYIGGTIYKLC